MAEPVPFTAVAGAAGAGQLVFGSDWPFAARLDGRSFGPRMLEPSTEQREALGTSFSSEQRAASGRDTATANSRASQRAAPEARESSRRPTGRRRAKTRDRYVVPKLRLCALDFQQKQRYTHAKQ